MASTTATSSSSSTAASTTATSSTSKFKPVSNGTSDVKGKAAAVTAAGEEQRELYDDSDIDRILAQEATGVQRDEECERVLKAFKLNPYDVLGVEPTVTDDEIHKTYRKKSLMIHPDRYHAPRGPEAFDLLKKAQTDLLNAEKRKLIDKTLADARMLILRSLNLPPETPDTHDKVRFLLPPMRERVKQKAKEILIDDELRRRRTNKMQMIAEGAEAQRVETAQAERKRKAEEKAQWEESREARVTDWRSFQKGTSKKKRPKVLG
ncbi:chaperone regulator [Cystobasidium minutum MCA 4210]|uniref:chaperone regulator n=1 Tax=Cystobasidium minutum MCA 4210 TaxID=1397322 RepID=UPI0034CF286F|eukprot:jgi/Rhomi1/114040/CE114039_4419